MDKDLRRPEYYGALVEFYANPADNRTLKQFAIDNGIAEDTVHQYKRRHLDEINADVAKLRDRYKPALRIAALKALFNRINKSDLAIKLAFQLTGDLIERTESKVEYMTPEDKRARIAQLLADIASKNKDNSEEKSG